MTAFKLLIPFKSLHFSRRAFVLVVSFWVGTLAFGLEKTPSKAKSEISEAHSYFNKKDFRQATALLWKNIDALSPKDFHILLKSHAELKQADELLRAAGLLISKNENSFEGYHYQGRAYFMKKKDKEALESFKKAIAVNKKYLPSYLSIATYYEEKKNLYELRVLYQDMLEAFGPRAEVLTKLCEIHTKDALNDTAQKYCSQATQVDPKIPENFVYLGIIHIQTEDRAKGRDALKLAAQRFPKSEVAQFSYGKVLEEDKNFIDAYKVFKQCNLFDKKSERCLLGYAISSFEIRKLEEAHAAYRQLCQINRSNAVYVRRALASLRATGPKEWTQKFQNLSDNCSN